MIRIAMLILATTPFLASPAGIPIDSSRDMAHRPYQAGEIDAIIAANPSPDDLIRVMLVGDDPVKVDLLVDAIVGPDLESPMVVAQR